MRKFSVVSNNDLPNDQLPDFMRPVHKEEQEPSRCSFETPAEALRFINAGNATVTLQSAKTGTHFTYKITRPENATDDVAFVSVLTGPDNATDFRYLGRLRRGVFLHGRKVQKPGDITMTAPSAMAWRWAYERLCKDKPFGDLIVMHEGRCGRCGRKLTHPTSIASGIGPECAQQMGL